MLSTLSGPYNGLAQKIAYIKECYPKSVTDARLRTFAEISAGRGNRETQAKNLYEAVKSRLVYLPDPVGVEMTKSPSVIMSEIEERGNSAGDCDDHACFNYALLQLIGIPARLRVAWYNGNAQPRHIYALAKLNGDYIPFDTTRRDGFKAEAKYSRKEDF